MDVRIEIRSPTNRKDLSLDRISKMGVTHAIRNKLNFCDDRQWKRFSARRLELIDTLDLSRRKASEQEQDIKRVAEILRTEFHYSESYNEDFDKLVRAAVQSVRRNRKRIHRKEKQQEEARNVASKKTEDHHIRQDEPSNEFFSDIVQHEDNVYDVNYDKSKQFSSSDCAKGVIDNLTRPRLPPLPNILSQMKASNSVSAETAKKNILNKIERSKTCNEAITDRRSNNLHHLGKSVMATCVGYIFEISFEGVNQQSVEYLRNKFKQEATLAKFFKELDLEKNAQVVNDEVAVISLYTLLGGIAKDFGFDEVIFPMCEILYVSIIKQYPLISKYSTPFGLPLRNTATLKELADVASKLQSQTSSSSSSSFSLSSSSSSSPSKHMSVSPTPLKKSVAPPQPQPLSIPPIVNDNNKKKKIVLKFLNQRLEFLYPFSSSATPRYFELIENARAVFKLNDLVLEIRYLNSIVRTDSDLEKIFRNSDSLIELEVITQAPVSIQNLTSIQSRNTSNEVEYGAHKDEFTPFTVNSVATQRGSTEEVEKESRTHFEPRLPRFEPLL
ncbi:hypothetical protein KGF56_004482 [Candida oxycetoniae]|uniref:Transcription factor VHR1 n=1 Tax=Candida oxycetoniae TaxID=497107 RepID=A0AAI9SU14_9ASCO|nr:uncharacterized protein KGF56_004482 [Candida oxycetoniae]KAI3402808.2 hypothetical protein KGF56_004482 [Candida oxycetoniae]